MGAITTSAIIGASSSGDNTIVAGVTGRRIVVTSYIVVNSVATAQSITWKSGSTARTGVMSLPSAIGGSIVMAGGDESPLIMTTPSSGLVLNLSAATAVAGHVTYYLR